MPSIESEGFSERMRAAVNLILIIFSQKVGNGLVRINKEVSMQLQYAYVLQHLQDTRSCIVRLIATFKT